MDSTHPYESLTPERVVDALEALGLPCDGRLQALSSYENRVYQASLEDGRSVVAKFYRPGRWSEAQILEEHEFAAELSAAEVPVVAPLLLDGRTLHRSDGFLYSVSPRRGGRAPELEVQDLWMLLSGERALRNEQLGCLLDGYEQMREFDRRELALIEPLRTLRLIHYSAWLARRWDDPAFPRSFPWFGTRDYWMGQVQMLEDQIEAMAENPLSA